VTAIADAGPGPDRVASSDGAVAGSGIAGPRWSFEGFLPRSGRERRERVARIAADERGSVLYEAPSRVAATLEDLARACGADRPGAICRELTKLHEEIVRATLGELGERARSGELTLRGEFVIVVGAIQASDLPVGNGTTADARVGGLDVALAEVERRTDAGVARGEAARQVAAETGLPRRRLYQPPGRAAGGER